MSTTRFEIDASHSSINFSVRHLVIAKVRGRFTLFSGFIDLDTADITHSSVSAEIHAASIVTNDDKRDAHLRSPDFLDADRSPVIFFASNGVERSGTDLRVLGALTIRGLTRNVALLVEHLGSTRDPWGNERLAFAARTTIERSDFGLLWNQVLDSGGVLVGDKIEIEFDIEAVPAQQVAAE